MTVTGYGPHWLEVEAKHDYKYGYFSRHFHRRYQLPDRTDVNRLTSRVRFGVLTVEAPRFPTRAKITDVTNSYNSVLRSLRKVDSVPVQHESSSWWSRERRIPIAYNWRWNSRLSFETSSSSTTNYATSLPSTQALMQLIAPLYAFIKLALFCPLIAILCKCYRCQKWLIFRLIKSCLINLERSCLLLSLSRLLFCFVLFEI